MTQKRAQAGRRSPPATPSVMLPSAEKLEPRHAISDLPFVPPSFNENSAYLPLPVPIDLFSYARTMNPRRDAHRGLSLVY